jgi:hypothetical protein
MKLALTMITSLAFMSMVGASMTTPASAAPAHDNWAAATDGGELPPCPSMYRCRVQ